MIFFASPMTIYSNLMSVRGKNHTAFQETGKREQRVGKRIKQFYLLFDLSQPPTDCYSKYYSIIQVVQPQ